MTIVQSGQTLNVSFGQTSAGVVVLAGGTLNALFGGEIDSTVNSGGTDNISSGGYAASSIVSSGGHENVYSGGVATSATISSGGQQILSAGGTTTATIVDNGGAEYVQSGATASGTVLSGGTETIFANGTASNTVISQGGNEYVSGGTASSTVVNGGIENVVSGLSNNATVQGDGFNSGEQIVSSGAATNNSLISSAGIQILSSGGTSFDTVVSSGGVQEVLGSALGTIISSGSTQIISSGGLGAFWFSGPGRFQIAVTSVTDGGTEIVSSGGVVQGAVIDGGKQIVLSGGIVSPSFPGIVVDGSDILSGGLEIVSSGGVVDGVVIGSGSEQIVLSGGLVSASFPSFAEGTDILSGGIEIISSGGVASNTRVAGEEDVYGTSISGSVVASGILRLFGGTSSDTTISGGTLELLANAVLAGSTTFSAGSFLEIGSGYTLSNYAVSAGLTLEVVSGGTTSAIIVSSGGTVEFFGGATPSDTPVVRSGGTFAIGSGYTESNYIVSNGVSFEVASGGSVVNTTVSSGGSLVVSAGGVADPTVIFGGGSETIDSGATDDGAQISGGIQFVFGTASGAAIYSGSEVVESGGIASVTTISGGVMELTVGGSAGGAITFAGTSGTLQIDGTTMPANTIFGFQPGDTFYLSGVPFDSGGSVNLLPGNVLQITEGGQHYDLQLDPNQNFAGKFFHLNAAVSGGTFVTEDTTPCYCAGTQILTERGEVEVERLAIGDNLITADGAVRPIRWIGRRSYAGRFARGSHVLPICIKAGALDVDRPRRDLWVSPQHAMFLEGVLIEAIDLINGVSIIRADRVERVDYFHIELDTHDVIVAEGALSESFVDDDSRGIFQNAHEFPALYPNIPAVRPARYCAPRVARGAELEAARGRIAQRAGVAYRPSSNVTRPRALVVDSRVPQLGHDGGANAILDHIRALQAAGFEVNFLALGGDCSEAGALASLGVHPLSVPRSGRFSDFARAHTGQFDLVYLHRVETATRCLQLARRYFDAQIIYSVADLHHLRLQAQSAFDPERASDLMDEARNLALKELSAALSADGVITHSVSEAQQLEQIPSIAAAGKVRVIPWVVPLAPVQRAFADRSGLAFVGSFAHAPNVYAARWLVSEIMPLVWREAPEVQCLIVGSDISDDLRRELERPGVDVLGRVDRLGDAFERIRLTVAPLRFGAGLKDKVLRSMAAGVPCVGTAEAFRGMHELPAAIAGTCQGATASELAAALVRMHRDQRINARCAKAGLMYVSNFYNQCRVDTLIRDMAQPAFDRHRAKTRARLDCRVLEFRARSQDTDLAVAAGLANPVRRVVFS